MKVPTTFNRAMNLKNSDCLKVSIAVLKYTGVWMPENLTASKRIAYIIYRYMAQGLLYFLTVFAEIYYILLVLGDTERTVDATVLTLSHLVQAVKMTVIWRRQRRIECLIQFVDGPNFKKTDPTKRAVLDKGIRLVTMVGNFIVLAAATTAVFWCIVPTLKAELTLPLNTAWPFDISAPQTFAFMYFHSCVSVATVGVSDAALNYLVSGLMVLASIHLDVLCAELKEIGIRTDKRANEKSDTYNETITCIKYHQNIIKFVEELASIFGVSIFCQFLTTSVVVCMTLFKIMITTEPLALITLVFYLICVFLELLMYCYPGDLLLNKSLLVSEAAYPNEWSGPGRSRRLLLLTALRAQRALLVRAGGLFRVSLPTAAGVVRTAYSYYAFLRQKTSNEQH